ncbi:MAG: hypothetical protein WC554_12290 [Clostridia bacterium]
MEKKITELAKKANPPKEVMDQFVKETLEGMKKASEQKEEE